MSFLAPKKRWILKKEWRWIRRKLDYKLFSKWNCSTSSLWVPAIDETSRWIKWSGRMRLLIRSISTQGSRTSSVLLPKIQIRQRLNFHQKSNSEKRIWVAFKPALCLWTTSRFTRSTSQIYTKTRVWFRIGTTVPKSEPRWFRYRNHIGTTDGWLVCLTLGSIAGVLDPCFDRISWTWFTKWADHHTRSRTWVGKQRGTFTR